METILRTNEALGTMLPFVLGFVSGLMLLIVVIRIMFGSSVHRACIAWCVVPIGILALYAAAGSAIAYLAGYPGFACLLAAIAVSYGMLASLFVRLARAIV